MAANQRFMYIDAGSERLTTTFGDFEDLKIGPHQADSEESRAVYALVQTTGKLKKINLKTQLVDPLPHSTLL